MTDLGKEYGTALFMLACEEDNKKSYAEALDFIKEAFLNNPQYEELLSSPGIPLKERLDIIDIAFSSSVPEYVLCYLKLLCEKGRILCFGESVDEYKALLDAAERISNVKITSAVELTDEEKEKLKAKLETLEKGKVNAEYFINDALMGGLIIEMDGRIIDGSLRHRLQEMKDVMNK